ncbi:MAG: dihydrolipoyl dehydrogenase [Gemmatimonadetes bacterium]|nr:MAG: dihydrolipoyl dehydrogenase [Gemmatimonadota bacterium]
MSIADCGLGANPTVRIRNPQSEIRNQGVPVASFDVIVLGGGPAGYVCAIRCAQLGLATAVIEQEKLGGVCVNIGCIPTKALLHSAYIANLLKEAKDFGVEAGSVKTDYGVAMKRSRRVDDQNSKGVEFLMKKHKITIVRGSGVLQPGKKVKGGNDVYEAKKAIVIATGSRVKGIPQIGLEINKKTVISSDEALLMERIPETLAIIGAGAVGMEFADIFAAFGVKVTLVEALPRILPIEDAEASDTLAKSYRKRGIEVIAGAKVMKANVAKDKVTLDVEAGGEKKQVVAAAVLMAAGRAVNTENIGLKECGIQLTDRGFIKVDKNLQTTTPGYYAIGDVAGPPMLAHKGSREGVIVAELLAGQKPHPIKYDNVPSVTYCHPEVASIGLTEDQCKEKKLDYVAGKFPFSANGRARGTGETEGFVKILRDKKYGEILGAHIVGAHASEMIHELAVARENEYTVEEVDLAIHAHPTMSEAVAEAALDSLGRVLHI